MAACPTVHPSGGAIPTRSVLTDCQLRRRTVRTFASGVALAANPHPRRLCAPAGQALHYEQIPDIHTASRQRAYG